MRQPFAVPASMYSMKRSVMPVPRNARASGRISASFMPRFKTVLTLTGRPAARAARIPASTPETGNPTSLIDWKSSSVSASRLTVTRSSPAALSAGANRARSAALVVSATSTGVPSLVVRVLSLATSSSRCLRSSGSPPVRRSFFTPMPTNRRLRRKISSKVSSSVCARNFACAPYFSLGMQ